jgi:hypothetical protein
MAMSPVGPFHSLAEKRSWALHQEVARRFVSQPELLGRARRRVEGWLEHPGEHPSAERWSELLALDVASLVQALGDTGAEMCTLRQASPFAGALDARTRWLILAQPENRP